MASKKRELIDKNALKIDIAHIDWDKLSRDGALDDGINEVLKAIDDAQILDAVELIHAYWREDTFCSHCGHFAEDADGHIIWTQTKKCARECTSTTLRWLKKRINCGKIRKYDLDRQVQT